MQQLNSGKITAMQICILLTPTSPILDWLNTQGNVGSETKNKYQWKLCANPLAFKCSQLTRQFKLILDSNRKCLEVYPDDFHHKIKFRDELTDLVVRLKNRRKVI